MQLERVLASPQFSNSPRLSRFLRYIVEEFIAEQSNGLKESLIAMEVFRKTDYDPNRHSIVRTEAARLRARLAEYYGGPGANDPIVIELPKGGYVPSLKWVSDIGASESEPAVTGNRRYRWVAAALALAALLTGVLRLASAFRSATTIAVLPFANTSGTSANDYLAEGLTDEFIGKLAVVEGLEVRSRTSSSRMKGLALREIGRQLSVEYVIEGSVSVFDSRVRVSGRLIHVAVDSPILSWDTAREMSDLIGVQDEIANGIVNALRLKLGAGRKRYETSVAAYDLYLRARAMQVYPRGMGPSSKLLEQVVAKDPSFAPAWACLSAASAFRSIQFASGQAQDELEKLRISAEKAVELDPLLAEAQGAQGLAHAREGQWAQSEACFLRALQLNPNSADTREDYANRLLLVLGRNREALEQLRLAKRADPLSPALQLSMAEILLSLRNYDGAARECEDLPGDFPFKAQCLARVRLGRGNFDEAALLLSKAEGPEARGLRGYALAKSGLEEEARKLLSMSQYPNEQALIFAGLGDKERAIEALARMSVVGPQRIGSYLNYPELGFLNKDPRVNDICRRVGLPARDSQDR
ncbi:MAG: tetratricopeptide repeat protein [Bryobacteraceae bacterium]